MYPASDGEPLSGFKQQHPRLLTPCAGSQKHILFALLSKWLQTPSSSQTSNVTTLVESSSHPLGAPASLLDPL